MTIVSCSGRFHAFALAEQLEKRGLLTGFYTSYAWQKNKLMRRLTSRIDKEKIPAEKIHTIIPVAAMMRLGTRPFVYNEIYDKWVAHNLNHRKDYKVFIGWSGMSLNTIRKAKNEGNITVLERGSSHIRYQDKILCEEYKNFGIDFHIDPRTVNKELKEYEEADYIFIPSTFVRNSFLEMGVPASKLIQNPYGVSSHFKKAAGDFPKGKFRVLYLGSLTIRKGLIYLFKALKKLDSAGVPFEAWFIGKVDEEMKSIVGKYARPNWKFFGHINFYDLPRHISACDVAVHPSLEEGLSMVITQLLGCGVPVIATTNTGGEDVIEDGKNGYIVPIRDPQAIAGKIQLLYEDPERLRLMKFHAANSEKTELSWDNYGLRYAKFLHQAISSNNTRLVEL
ncbi:MAG: glycosyltransferase family 4 protein [Saprospiraceae bacterium]